jgi:hypothetical protein
VNNNYNSNTVVKQDFAVVKQVDGRAAHMTDTTRHQSWQSTPPPLPGHAGSIPEIIKIFNVLSPFLFDLEIGELEPDN